MKQFRKMLIAAFAGIVLFANGIPVFAAEAETSDIIAEETITGETEAETETQTGLTVVPDDIVIGLMQSLTLGIGGREAVWESSDPEIASVTEDGTVTGLKAGRALITATATSGESASCAVRVRLARPVIKAKQSANNKIFISWNPVEDAEGYQVYRSTEGAAYKKIASVTDPEDCCFTASAVPGRKYSFKVYAAGPVRSLGSIPAECSTVMGAPDVSVSSTTSKSITLSWSKAVGASSYLIYRSDTKNGTYKKIANTKNLTCTDKVPTNKTYYYIVRAYRSSTEYKGKKSKVVAAKASMAAPKTAGRVRLSSTSYRVTWSKVSGATGYVIFRSEEKAGPYTKVKTASGNSWTDKGLQKNKTYYYRVACRNKNGISKKYRTAGMLVTTSKKPASKVITYSMKTQGDMYLSKHFKVKQFQCHDNSDKVLVDQQLVYYLEKVWSKFGKVSLHSCYRTKNHNTKVGGASNSMHLYGKAADFDVRGVKNRVIAVYCEKIGVQALHAYYPEAVGPDGWVHIDTRDEYARW